MAQKPILIEDYICNFCSIDSISKQLNSDNDPESPVNRLKQFIVDNVRNKMDDLLENLSKIVCKKS